MMSYNPEDKKRQAESPNLPPNMGKTTQPCDWCEREDQETCPDCNGTGFIEVEDSEG